MDRKLARRNLRTAFFAGIIGVLMFALTFVAALVYIHERASTTTARSLPSGRRSTCPAPSILPLINAAALSLAIVASRSRGTRGALRVSSSW